MADCESESEVLKDAMMIIRSMTNHDRLAIKSWMELEFCMDCGVPGKSLCDLCAAADEDDEDDYCYDDEDDEELDDESWEDDDEDEDPSDYLGA